MAHQPPPLVKHPAGPPPHALVGNPLPNIVIPRKEFIKDHRVTSSFSLLALSGSSLVRLYSFSAGVVSSLRRFFDQKHLLAKVREDATNHFFECTLEGKPWGKPKSITSEKLIVDILAVIFHHGYIFLSSIDYGREQDDRLAIAFSKPTIPASGMPHDASATSLHQPIRTPFAISFISATVLRVVGAPLQSTPAVLSVMRGTWPRGVLSDRKVGDATYEFKLKGYKWFQEDTFAADSLHHILGMLQAFDGLGFMLLTSLTMSTRSRVKDLWIFTATDETYSVPSTPTTSNGEQAQRHNVPQVNIVPGPSPLAGPADRRNAVRQLPTPPVISSPDGTANIAAGFKFAQPPFKKLIQRVGPGMQNPIAFVSEYVAEGGSRPYPTVASRMSAAATDLPPSSRPQAPRAAAADMVRGPSNLSSVGSLDMTGVGSGKRVSVSPESPRTPDVFYTTDGRGANVSLSPSGTPLTGEYHPYTGAPNAQPPHAAFVESPRTRRASLESRMALAEQRPTLSRPAMTRSSTLPMAANMSKSASGTAAGNISFGGANPNAPDIQVHAPSPAVARSQEHALLNGEADTRTGHEGENVGSMNVSVGKSTAATRGLSLPPLSLPGPRRTPTPPLLTPGTFRDSAFSSVTGKSQEVPIAWVGKDAEAVMAGASSNNNDTSSRSQPQTQAQAQAQAQAQVETQTQTRGQGLASSRHAPAHAHAFPAHQTSLHKGGADAGYHRLGGAAGLGEHAGWERSDVGQGYRAVPPTIREQPSKESEEMRMMNANMTTQPSRRAQRTEPIRERDERTQGQQGQQGQGQVSGQSRGELEQNRREEQQPPRGRTGKTANGAASEEKDKQKRPASSRRDTAMSGWVMVNVEGATPVSEKPSTRPGGGGHTKAASQSPPGAGGKRPVARHQRSLSESNILRSNGSANQDGRPSPAVAPASATMSAAAKTIAMIDAVDARDHQSPPPMGGLRRLFHRSKASGDARTSPPPDPAARVTVTPPGTWSRRAKAKAPVVQATAAVSMPQRNGETGARRAQSRGVPIAARAGDRRINLD